MTDKSARGRSRPGPALWLAAAFAALVVCTPARAESRISVHVDQARVIKLPERAATVVIGNPLIADLTLEPHGLAVITGKGYGATNVIVLDKDGAVLAEHNLEVQEPIDPTVVVYRGADDRRTYSCTPECSRRLTLGDEPVYFDKTMTQITSRNAQAMAAGAAQQH
jgi:hypothetical protein